MKWKQLFSRDARHIWRLALIIVVGGAGALVFRSLMIPETFGDLSGRYGPYRAAALSAEAAKPMVINADHICLECHSEVGEERAESPHVAVRCYHCHGMGHAHIASARKAEETGEDYMASAQVWDGDFKTEMDLYITENRRTCLVCHESVVGMPDSFRKIVVADHLEEQEAEEVDSPAVCFECHSGHDPAP